MAKKQAIVKETAAAATPASSARAAKPKTPRVTAAQHSKVVSTEPSFAELSSTELPSVQAGPESIHFENAQEVIATIAYSYWESRGCQGGSPIEDWVRAEHEFRQRSAATRL
jgi:hypothetical protein